MQLFRQILQNLKSPDLPDAAQNRLALMIDRIMLLAVTVWLTGTAVQALLGLVVSWQNIGVTIAGNLILLMLRGWLRRGAVRPVAYAFTSLVWLIITLQLINLGGIQTLHAAGYLATFAMATLINGPLAGLAYLLLSIAAILLLGFAQQAGLLGDPVALTIGNQQAVIILSFVLFFILVLIIRNTMTAALHNAEREIAQRRQVEEELRALNATLDQRVAERTRALKEEVARHAQTEAELRKYSEALSINEARFRAIYENTPIAYQSLDENGCFLSFNHNLCRLLGYERDELEGRSFGDVWHPQDRPAFPERFEAFKSRGIVHINLALMRKDGRQVMTILDGRVEVTPDGRFVRTHCLLTDVTEHHQLQARIQHQNTMFSTIYQSMLDFLHHRSIDDLLQSLVEHAASLLNAPYCEINTVEGDELVVRACTKNQAFIFGDRSKSDESRLSWQAVMTREPVVLPDYQLWPHRRNIYETVPLHAVGEIPILSGDGETCLGVISIGRVQPDDPFSPDEIQIAQLYTQVAGLAIENAQLQTELREQTIHDPLTGLFNRRYLFETIQRELARARRETYPVSFVLLDIDYFKQLNDRYGHHAGDVVLCAMADQFKQMVRASDILCRYGGDEHLIILYKTPIEIALVRAEQWRQAIEAMVVPFEGQQLQITISLGVAVFPDQGKTIDQVIAFADKALYHSKNGGRNQVTAYQETPEY